MKIAIPKDAEKIISILNENGYEAYVVGGCVRDSILGREPEDWDITTSAKPAQIKELFRKTIDTGIQHGTVTIRMGGCSYETTTYRIDGVYEDRRHPKNVEFTSQLSEDLKRRDFTINAMAYNPETGLVDLYGGIDDLKNKIIRCVGNANERFDEDALRTLRAVRFAGQLGFKIEEKTYEAIRNASGNIKDISIERIRTEITKLIISPGADRMLLVNETGLSAGFLPEWERLVKENKAERVISIINYINRNISSKDGDNFREVDLRSHKILCYGALLLYTDNPREILNRLKFDNYSIDKITRLIRFHDVSAGNDRYHMKKIIHEAGTDVMELLFLFKEAIAQRSDSADNEEGKKLYHDIMTKEEPVFIKDLKITGKDLIDKGIPAGKELGDILDALLEEVLLDPNKNTVDYLTDKAKKIYENR